ncbi:MAG: hypothetical protein ACFE0I_08250 [Elainellaceae cyanobacterium]
MNTCPCCSEQLLRHARHSTIYWFCPHCRQEMPNFSAAVIARRDRHTPLETLVADSFDLAHSL